MGDLFMFQTASVAYRSILGGTATMGWCLLRVEASVVDPSRKSGGG